MHSKSLPSSFVTLSLSLLLMSLFAQTAAARIVAPTPPAGDEKPARADIYDAAADGEQQVAEAVAKAKRENRRVLIQWGANWCGWCHLLHDLFKKDKDISRELLYEYDVVLIDVNDGKHAALAERLGADFKNHGLPYLTVLDGEGAVLANQDTGSLEAGKVHDPKKVLAFLKAHEAAPLAARDVLAAATARAREDGKEVFLHYGAPWCGWCHRLEDWIALPEVNPILARYFVDCKIDTDRMTDGQTMLNEHRGGEEGGIPWFAVLNGEGATLATSDGANGNLGFPYSDEEVAQFGEILAKAGVPEEDRAALLKTMGEKKADGKKAAEH